MKKNLINPKNVRLARLNQRTCSRPLSEIVNMDEETYAIATLNGNSKKADIVGKMKNGYDECLSGKFPCIPEPLFFFAFPEYAKEKNEILSEQQAINMLFEGEGIDENTHYTLLGGNTRFSALKKEKQKIYPGLFININDRLIGKTDVNYGRLFKNFSKEVSKCPRQNLRLMFMFIIMYYNEDARTQGLTESRIFINKFIKEYVSKEDFDMSNTNLITAILNLFDGYWSGLPFNSKQAIEACSYCAFRERTTEDAAQKMASVTSDCFGTASKKARLNNDLISDNLKSCGIDPFTLSINDTHEFEKTYSDVVTCINKEGNKCDVSYVSSKAKKFFDTMSLNDVLDGIAKGDIDNNVKEKTLLEACEEVLEYCKRTNTNPKDFVETFLAIERNKKELK